MGGFQHNFFQGIPNMDDINNSLDTLETGLTILTNKVFGLEHPEYNFGETATPYSFNGNRVYVWRFNPDQTLTMPNSGYVAIGNNQWIDVISVNIMGNVINWETGIEWFQMPMMKRNNANNIIYFALTPDNHPAIKNIGVVGNLKVRGYIVYTR